MQLTITRIVTIVRGRGVGSDQVKTITGIRRCGESYFVRLFRNCLVESGMPQESVIEMAFERFGSRAYRDPNAFHAYAPQHLSGDGP